MGLSAIPCVQEVRLENAGAWADLAEDDGEGEKPKQNGEDHTGDDEDEDGGEGEEKGDDLWEQFQSREEQQLQQAPPLRLSLRLICSSCPSIFPRDGVFARYTEGGERHERQLVAALRALAAGRH